MVNPFHQFLNKNTMISASSARHAEAAWDMALELAMKRIEANRSILGNVELINSVVKELMSTKQRFGK